MSKHILTWTFPTSTGEDVKVKVSMKGKNGDHSFVAETEEKPGRISIVRTSRDINELSATMSKEVNLCSPLIWERKIVVSFSGGDTTGNLFGLELPNSEVVDHKDGARFELDLHYWILNVATADGKRYYQKEDGTVAPLVTLVSGKPKDSVSVLDYSEETEAALRILVVKADMLAKGLRKLLRPDNILATLRNPPWSKELSLPATAAA